MTDIDPAQDPAPWAVLEREIGEIRSICYDMLQEIKKLRRVR